MAKEYELQRASLSGYKLFALLKVAAFAADELEESEVKALFELAYDLSVPVSTFLQLIEEETVNKVNNNSTIETVRDTADNLYHLLDLMFSQFKEMEPGQAESLIGLSYELACQISSWTIAEEKRRNG